MSANLLFSDGSLNGGSLKGATLSGRGSRQEDWGSTSIDGSWGVGTDGGRGISTDGSWGISADWSRGISRSRGRGVSWGRGSVGNRGTLVLDISNVSRVGIKNVVGDNLGAAIGKGNTVTSSGGVAETGFKKIYSKWIFKLLTRVGKDF